MANETEFAKALSALLAVRGEKKDDDSHVMRVVREMDAHAKEIDDAFEKQRLIMNRIGIDGATLREKAAFTAGVGFVMLMEAERQDRVGDVSQQIVDAIRAFAKTEQAKGQKEGA